MARWPPHFRSQGRKLMLLFERRLVDLVADRVGSRSKQLARPRRDLSADERSTHPSYATASCGSTSLAPIRSCENQSCPDMLELRCSPVHSIDASRVRRHAAHCPSCPSCHQRVLAPSRELSASPQCRQYEGRPIRRCHRAIPTKAQWCRWGRGGYCLPPETLARQGKKGCSDDAR